MRFRERLLASLRAIQPVLDVPGVMIGGSQVPNLLQSDAASTLVVSQDVDLVIPVSQHVEAKKALEQIRDYRPAPEEPSVWIPENEQLLEINFIGLDRSLGPSSDAYVFHDDRLPLLVFGLLSHLREGALLEVEGIHARLPRPAGLLIEKLLTERTGIKGQRDLLVALGLILTSTRDDFDEVATVFRNLTNDDRKTVTGSLTVLALMTPIKDMPDPDNARQEISDLAARLEAIA